jgi:phosphatidylserine/phosphatidylglycerophosphate/cardiolipin synthase-like enzyme
MLVLQEPTGDRKYFPAYMSKLTVMPTRDVRPAVTSASKSRGDQLRVSPARKPAAASREVEVPPTRRQREQVSASSWEPAVANEHVGVTPLLGGSVQAESSKERRAAEAGGEERRVDTPQAAHALEEERGPGGSVTNLGRAISLLEAVGAQEAMSRAVQQAKSSVDVLAYTFDEPELLRSLKEAAARGIVVRLLADRSFSMSGRCRRQLQSLEELAGSGGQVRLLDGVPGPQNIYGGAQHSKALRADNQLILGSCNLTSNSRTNFELDVHIELSSTGYVEFEALFAQRWKKGLAIGGRKAG